MQLLSARQVKDTKRRKDVEQRERVKKLNTLENEAVRSFNQTKESISTKIEALNADLEARRVKHAEEKEELRKEIASLKEQRKELMKPVSALHKEAEKVLADAHEKHIDLARREKLVEKDRREIAEQLEAIVDREEDYTERASELDRREIAVAEAEKKNQDTAVALGEKWTEYHAAVHESNLIFREKEKDMFAREQSVIAKNRLIDEREKDLEAREKLLKDRRGVLDRAWAELEIKKQNHGK